MDTRQKILLALGVVGLGALSAAPSFAAPGQAYVSGSATIVQMNGATMSVGGEIAAPGGTDFITGGGNVTVTPTYVGNLTTNSARISNLDVTASGTIAPSSATGSFTATAAQKLLNAAGDLQAEVSIIRAGAGPNGLD